MHLHFQSTALNNRFFEQLLASLASSTNPRKQKDLATWSALEKEVLATNDAQVANVGFGSRGATLSARFV
jgi:inhibitor of KinA sporulation pathway (predicted exonuclease)